MDTLGLLRVARRYNVAVGLTFDPTAPTPAEAWIASVGLNGLGAGQTPEDAMLAALSDADERIAGVTGEIAAAH